MPEKNKKNNNTEKGFVALLAIIIILGVVLMISLSVSSLGIGEAGMSLQKSQSSHAFYLASLCVEEALMKLKENQNYAGNDIINIEDSSCQILPIEGSWTIKAQSSFMNQIKKIKVVITQINPTLLIESWQEVADF